MDPDEPLTVWFDDVFRQWGDDRSAALRRRLATTRVRIAGLVASEHPGADLTPDLFLACVPMLLLEVHLPVSGASARTHVSAVSRLVDAAPVPAGGRVRAHDEVVAARLRLVARAADRPDDPNGSRIPRRLLSG